MCPRALDQFLLTRFVGFGRRKEAKSLWQCAVYAIVWRIWLSVTLASLMASIRISKFCGIRLGVLLLLGARCMIFLEGWLSLICREIGEHCSFDVFFVYPTFCIEDLLSPALFVISSSC